jgi:hypothetical protein
MRWTALGHFAAAIYWHFALQAFPIAFLAQVVYASASFFGFADDGSVAESMQVAAADVQLWIPSRAV